MSRRGAALCLAGYVAGVAAVTLGPSPARVFQWTAETAHQLGAQGVTYQAVERGANVILFVPIGLLLCLALPGISRWLIWLSCVLVSAGVELTQSALPDRQTTALDVLTNAAGAGIGVLLAVALRRQRGSTG